MAAIRIGLAGWSYKDWAGIVYPSPRPRAFREPAYLAEFFDTLEINTSFYGPPRPDTCRQWIDYVSGNARFLFTAKLWQKFTHERNPASKTNAPCARDSTFCMTQASSAQSCCNFRFHFITPR